VNGLAFFKDCLTLLCAGTLWLKVCPGLLAVQLICIVANFNHYTVLRVAMKWSVVWY